MRLRKFTSLVFVLAAVAIFVAPTSQANADPGVLNPFEADCNQTSTPGTFNCIGNLIGYATLTEGAFEVTNFDETCPGPNDACFLDSEDITITTADGSTLSFRTSGVQFDQHSTSSPDAVTANFRRNNSYWVTGGTGRFAKVTAGAGNYVLSGNLAPGSNFVPSTIHLD
jgi:hypothetical protein